MRLLIITVYDIVQSVYIRGSFSWDVALLQLPLRPSGMVSPTPFLSIYFRKFSFVRKTRQSPS